MSGNTTGIWFVALAGLALAGCSSIPNPFAAAEPVPVEPEAAAQTENNVEVPVNEPVAQTTALIYEWDTQYSAFLSPPIEVRRQAKNDCVADGYEIAVVETLKLDGNVATAVFICRGDFE